MSRRRAGLLAVVVAVSAVALFAWAPVSGGDEVPTLVVRPERFELRVPAEGNLSAVRASTIGAPAGSRRPQRIAWLAADGAVVEEGEVVVRFDPSEMEKEHSDASSDLAIAELQSAQHEVESAAVSANLDRDATSSEMELAMSTQFESRDPEVYSRLEIVRSEIDVELAQERRDQALGTKVSQDELARAEAGLLDIAKRQAEMRQRRAADELANLEVRAPHAGILIFERLRGEPIRVGHTVWPGANLAEIPILDELQAEVYVLEADAGALEVGKSAEVVVEAHTARRWPARIKRVDSVARPRLRGSPVQYLAVELELESTDPTFMRPGQRVTGTLLLAEIEDALVVPRHALFEEGGRSVVYRRERGGFEPVEVTLGVGGAGRVVVTEGLEPGDEIALVDPTVATQSATEASGPALPEGSE